MRTNMGKADRTIRTIIGIALIAFVLLGGVAVSSLVGVALLILGAVLVLTGLSGFCPLYVPFGADTK